jgi:hypothetical protein
VDSLQQRPERGRAMSAEVGREHWQSRAKWAAALSGSGEPSNGDSRYKQGGSAMLLPAATADKGNTAASCALLSSDVTHCEDIPVGAASAASSAASAGGRGETVDRSVRNRVPPSAEPGSARLVLCTWKKMTGEKPLNFTSPDLHWFTFFFW